jgi:uncharacterized Zn finger protein
MKNPTRALRRTLERAKGGAAAVSRRLHAVVAEALSSVREQRPTIAADLAAMVAHHLILAVIERAIAWLFRNFGSRPPGAQVLPFPALRPVP